jgi:uncharacterized membrane protein YedE/YeeE
VTAARLRRVARCSNCGATLDDDVVGSARTPCPECGSTARTHEGAAGIVATSSVSATLTVDRGLNDTRLAVLGIIVGIGLTIGFGVPGPWWVRFASGLAAIGFTMFLIRLRASRHRLMVLMHWLTGQ